jgi:O-succinylbenzoic acid--CoA ligase
LLVILRALFAGAPLTVHAGFDPAAVAADGDGAFVSLVPTMLLRLLDAGCDAGRFACLLVGGAGLPTALAERARAAGARLVPTYGMTESCGGVVYDGTPLDGVGVRTGAAGEIELGGPTLMARYRDDADATVAAFTTDGWLRTGDSGWVDGAGRLHVAGRLDDLILTGGEKVWPAEVEAVLADHPLVAQVAVSARPDPEWGQRVVAHVVPRRAENAPTLSGLRRFAAGRLARYKAPAELVVVDRLPPRDRKLALPEPGAPGGVPGPGRPAGDGPLVQ